MKIPPGHTEESVLEAIEKVVNVLAPSFVFGYFQLEDIQQQSRLFALKVLEKGKYDPSRPLENFLYTGVYRLLLNLQRDKLKRNEPPCKKCHKGESCEDAYDGQRCERYNAWVTRNQAKANLLRPLDLNHISDEKERRTRLASSVHEEVEIDEILKRIDVELPVELRSAYLQMRAGVSVPRAKRQQVEAAVKLILGGEVECQNEDD